MNAKFVALLLASACALAGMAYAQDAAPANPAPAVDSAAPTRHAHVTFKQADANHDGKLTRDEAQAMPWVYKHFDEIDSNHDGYITRDELRAARRAERVKRAQRHPNPPPAADPTASPDQ